MKTLNSLTPDGISEDLDRSNKILEQLQAIVTKLSTDIHIMESRLKANESSSAEIEIPDRVGGVILIGGPVSSHDSLLQSVNKARAKHRGSLAFVEVGDFKESQSTCERVRSIIEVRLRKRLQQDGWLVSLRSGGQSPFLEDKKSLVLGDRFCRDRRKRLDVFVTRMTKLGYHVSRDNGLYGGGPLVYSLLNAEFLNEVDLVTEITISAEMAKRNESVVDIIEALCTT